MKKGLFITFEGIDGSGKSTQIALLAAALKNAGRAVLKTREPGGTGVGERIRSLLLGRRAEKLDPRSEMMLYLAGRIQHVTEVIAPALSKGRIVLCDRFSDTTIAYQGYAMGLPVKWVTRWVAEAQIRLQPDITFLLDLDVPVALARLGTRNVLSRFDLETVAFHEAVRKGYLRLARQHRRRIQVINAHDPIETISSSIRGILDASLP